MKKYLVDTTVLIDHLRDQLWATEFLKKEGLVIPIVSVAELIQGARNKSEQKLIEKLVNQFEVDWGSARINRLAIDLLNKHFLKSSLKFLDALIAATALENKLILVTSNIKHFQFITSLQVVLPKDI